MPGTRCQRRSKRRLPRLLSSCCAHPHPQRALPRCPLPRLHPHLASRCLLLHLHPRLTPHRLRLHPRLHLVACDPLTHRDPHLTLCYLLPNPDPHPHPGAGHPLIQPHLRTTQFRCSLAHLPLPRCLLLHLPLPRCLPPHLLLPRCPLPHLLPPHCACPIERAVTGFKEADMTVTTCPVTLWAHFCNVSVIPA